MADAGYLIGFAHFTSALRIEDVAQLLSSKAFGGIDFVEKDVDEEYDLGTLTLKHDFLGLQVDLFGQDGKYTVELGTRPSASVPGIEEVCDLSAMLQQCIGTQKELVIVDGF